MKPVPTYPDWSYLVGILNRVASSDDHVDSTTLASMPWVIALDGEDSIEYSRRVAIAVAAAAAAAGAPPSVMAVPVESAEEQDRGKPELWRTFYISVLTAHFHLRVVPRTSAQLCHPLRHTSTSDASPASTYLTPRARFRRSFTDFISPHSVPGGTPSLQSALSPGGPSSTGPPAEAEAIPESDTTAETLEDLHKLAAWPRLRNATLPDPLVGAVESDPAGAADQLGVKGLSVYTSFIEMESLQCRVCGDQSTQLGLAVLHQRHQRHFQQ